MNMRSSVWFAVLLAAIFGTGFATGCAGSRAGKAETGKAGNSLELDVQEPWADPAAGWQRTAHPYAANADPRVNPDAPAIVIRNATILTATGQRFDGGAIMMEGGSIKYVGKDAPAMPAGATVIDATGKFVTPGIIDAHSHIGVYSVPKASAQQDGNEMVAPVTAQARAEYGYFSQDPSITRATAGGVTSALILPGSANMVGGRAVVVQMIPGRSMDEVVFPGAPPSVKMACGENPKRVYGEKGGPQTRMGLYAAFRDAFQKAAEYDVQWREYRRSYALWQKKRARAAELEAAAAAAGKKNARVAAEVAPTMPAFDAGLDTLAAILHGKVLVQIHCYRAGELREMVRLSQEFGFPIRSFHHALEAYKVRDLLIANDIAINTWADWWGFKMEAFDGIPQNAALFAESGGRSVIHSDSEIGIQRLNQEAAKAMWAGRHAGIDISEDQALRWITLNPAWVAGIDAVTGSLEVGKRADVVIWDRDPFSVYARAENVFVGGELAFDREAGLAPTDFELGNSALPLTKPETTQPTDAGATR